MKSICVTTLVTSVLIGCGSEVKGPDVVPLSGTVKVDGQPVAGARISFIPSDPKTNAVSGLTKEDGQYEVYYGSRSGAPAGDYKVAISYLTLPDGSPYKASPGGLDVDQMKMQGKVVESLPPKVSDPTQTELKLTVPKEGKKDANFDVSKAKK